MYNQTMSDDSADLDQYYGNLRNYVRMVTGGYQNLLLLDAKGGLGKTYNVRQTLSAECEGDDKWIHQKGFTTPIELYKTLWMARREDTVLFLDDMSGVTNNQKAIDMLKAATETDDDENFVEYRTSQDIDHPTIDGATLPNTFTFRGRIVMSFNDTPDNHHFDALRDRGIDYHLSFTYQERLDLVSEVAKLDDFSDLSVEEQKDTAEWIATTTNAGIDVTLRTFEEVCAMRAFANDTGESWEKMALEVFDMNYAKYLIIEMRERMEMTIDEQVEQYKEKTGYSKSHYYDTWDSIRDERTD